MARPRLAISAASACVLLLGVALRIAYLGELSTHPQWSHFRGDEAHYFRAAHDLLAGTCSPFHMSPGYIGWLATLFATLGDGPLAWRLAHLALGVITAGFVAGSAGRIFGPKAVPWALGLTLLYAPALFYEGNLAVATLAKAATAALVYASIRALDAPRGPSGRWLAGAAVAIGVATLARPNAFLLAPALAVVVVTRSPRQRRLWGFAAMLIVVPLAMTAPVAAHNARCGSAHWMTDTGGLNFYVGNREGANGMFQAPPRVPEAKDLERQREAFHEEAQRATGRELSPSEASRYWFSETWAEIRRSPGSWIGLMAHKLWLLHHETEWSNTRSFEFHTMLLYSLGPWLLHNGVLLPFVVLGLLLWARRVRTEPLLPALYLTLVVANASFFVLGRYRQPLTILWLLAAMAGAKFLYDAWRAHHLPRLLGGLAVCIVAFVATRWPLYHTSIADEAYKHAYALHVAERLDEAEHWYLEALVEDPAHRSARRNLAILLSRSGRGKDAVPLWTAILEDARAAKDPHAEAEALTFLSEATSLP